MIKWINLADKYPPYDKPVLVSDGLSCQIRILRLNDGIKYWESLSNCNISYSPAYWMPLPKLPEVS